MYITVSGVLRTPTFTPLPNHEIKITSLHTKGSIQATRITHTTDADGAYSFNLIYGTYTLEVLINDTYTLSGKLIVNSATPNPIDLETLVQYSEPVELSQMMSTTAKDASTSEVYAILDQIRHKEGYVTDQHEIVVDPTNSKWQSKKSIGLETGEATLQEEYLTYVSPSELIASIKRSLQNTFGTITTSQEISNETITLTGSVSDGTNTSVETVTPTKHTIDTGEFNVNNTLSVTDGKVVITGTLQINQIQDGDGNSLDVQDGDTIFLVYQYSDSALGPWTDTRDASHKWARDNWSVNGVIDPDGWGEPYAIGAGEAGADGDTIYWEYNYSPDGITDWTENLKSGDAYRRERQVINGTPSEWSEPAYIRGESGSTIEIRSQYSVDGVYDWHYTFTEGDSWERRARFVDDVQDGVWGDPFQIGKGDTGDSVYNEYRYGPTSTVDTDWTAWGDVQRDTDFWAQTRTVNNGTATSTSEPYRIVGFDGAGWYTLVNDTGNFPDDQTATIEFFDEFGRMPVRDDHLTYVDDAVDPSNSSTKRCASPQGTAIESVIWNTPLQVIDGDLVIKGTLSGDRVIANSLNGNTINSASTIIAGSGSGTAGMNGDDSDDAGIYAGTRFWAGAADPANAPFRVDEFGNAYLGAAQFGGTLPEDVSDYLDASFESVTNVNLLPSKYLTATADNPVFLASGGLGFDYYEYSDAEVGGSFAGVDAVGIYKTSSDEGYIYFGESTTDYNMTYTYGGDLIVSMDAYCEVGTNVQIYIRAKNGQFQSSTVWLEGGEWNRISAVIEMDSIEASQGLLRVDNESTGEPLFINNVQVENRIGDQTEPSPYKASGAVYPSQDSIQLSSSSYKQGVFGWAIDNYGNSEFNNMVIRGTVYATDGEFTGLVKGAVIYGGVIYGADISTSGDVGVQANPNYPEMLDEDLYYYENFDRNLLVKGYAEVSKTITKVYNPRGSAPDSAIWTIPVTNVYDNQDNNDVDNITMDRCCYPAIPAGTFQLTTTDPARRSGEGETANFYMRVIDRITGAVKSEVSELNVNVNNNSGVEWTMTIAGITFDWNSTQGGKNIRIYMTSRAGNWGDPDDSDTWGYIQIEIEWLRNPYGPIEQTVTCEIDNLSPTVI